jgi:hypothetical protein
LFHPMKLASPVSGSGDSTMNKLRWEPMPKTRPLKTTNLLSDPLRGEHFDQESLLTRQKKLEDSV